MDTIPCPPSVSVWDHALRGVVDRLYEEYPSDAADLLSEAERGVPDEQAFRDCLIGRDGLDAETIEFAVESVRSLSIDNDQSSGRNCVYPAANAV